MARIYRPKLTIPIPSDAEIFVERGKRFARFTRKGRTIKAPFTESGKHVGERVCVEARKWAIEFTDAPRPPVASTRPSRSNVA